MKVQRFNDSIDSPALLAATAPEPQPGRGEVLIRVHAAGVTPAELSWYPTTHTPKGEKRSGAVPGHEFSGVIVATGELVDSALVGQEVFGMNDWFAEGATAEYCLSQPEQLAPKPARLSHAEAAAVPIGALTAWQGLISRAKVQTGERVLIHGGAGAVGVFAVQLARRAGAHVIATASARHTEFLQKLGANEVIDYRSGQFEEMLRGSINVVFDAVGGETLAKSWSTLRPSGRLVTISSVGEATQDERTKAAFFIVEPNREQLTEIAGLLERGELQVFVDAVAPLAEASAAYRAVIPRPNGYGKVVIEVADGVAASE